MTRRTWRVLLAVSGVLALTSLSLGGAAARAMVPFHAELKGSTTATPTSDGLLAIDVTGSGEGTHFGKMTTTQHHLVNPATGLITDGTYTLTAANGDTVYGSYTAQGAPLPSGGFSFQGQWTIEGGTGRFSGASGGGPAHGTQFADGTFDLILDGTISSVGSLK